MIEKFISKFTDQKLLHVEKIGRQYYQILPELKQLMDKVGGNLNREAHSAGVFLGEEKGKQFMPSLALLDMVGRLTDRWVLIDENSEWLFLCGRDVFAKSVIKANVRHGIVLVANIRKEVLGYGEMVGELGNTNRVCLKNFLDRGDFLRREMRKKAKGR